MSSNYVSLETMRTDSRFRQPVKRLFVGKVYQCGSDHHTYHGSKLNPKFGEIHFALDLAKESCEPERKQGSYFCIRENIALVLGSDRVELLLYDCSGSGFLGGDILPGAIKGRTVADLSQSISESLPGCIVFVEVAPGQMKPADIPFYYHESHPRGSGEKLGWEDSPRDHQAVGPAFELLSHCVIQIQDLAQDNAN